MNTDFYSNFHAGVVIVARTSYFLALVTIELFVLGHTQRIRGPALLSNLVKRGFAISLKVTFLNPEGS